MKKMARNCSKILAVVLVTVLLAACGSKNEKSVTSTTTPTVFYSHSVAISSGSIYSWGANNNGQLGNGVKTGGSQLTPKPVIGNLTGMKGVSAGGTHTLAFVENGPAYAWGNNGFGQLGNIISIGFYPVRVYTDPGNATPLDQVTMMAAGWDHSLALDGNGDVWAWGYNSQGQLGEPTTTPKLTFAMKVHSLDNVTMIAAGGEYSLAIVGATANAYSWGNNNFGQLGRGRADTIIPTPGIVVEAGDIALTGVTHIAAGGSHSLFVDGVGNVWACGYNVKGQLGVGGTQNRSRVVQIVNDSNGNPFTGAIAVAAGLDHSLAIIADSSGTKGTVWAWGYNFSGQLGNPLFKGVNTFGTFTAVTRPVRVMVNATTPLSGVTKIVAIGNHSLALKADNTLWAWGENSYGQLGNNTAINSKYAIEVKYIPLPADLYMPVPSP